MSVINKKPFIKSLFEDMSDEEKITLAGLVDGGGNQVPILRTLNDVASGNRTHITNSDKGVHLCNIQAEFSLFQGYLIYTDHYCVLVYFTDAQVLGMFNISLTDPTKFATVDEALDILELRSELADVYASGVVLDRLEVSDITALTNEQLDQLKVGDSVVKITGKQKHNYIVTYKGDGAGQGICLTYSDASIVETVSYDRSGSGWAYNSTDVTELGASTSGSKLIIQSLENIDFDELIGDGNGPVEAEFETGLTSAQKEALWDNPSQIVIKVWVNAEASGNYDQVFLTKNNQYIATSAEEGGEPTVERCCKFDAHFISTEEGFSVYGFEIGIYIEGQPDGQPDGFIRYHTTNVSGGE